MDQPVTSTATLGAPPTTAAPAPAPSPAAAQPTRAASEAEAADGAAGASDCKAADLKLSIRDGEGAAGTVYRTLVFTNAGSRTCTMQGFPGVSYVTGDDGHQVGPAAYRDGTKGAPVTMAPGVSSSTVIGFVNVQNFDPAACQPTETRGLRVYPPHDTASMFLPLPGTGCSATPPGNQLTVKTVS
ncbi:DUF4232 domain-containing protein [Actinokineospora sp. PR83]|uniref:DUF4232 domain-containing protein n=1 Tax=Actinokineospora sp. PR83 TaxID=2884908 RepID=UPI0027E1C0E8|nr:DUF4232 domain-containing protein [Actinokineospora sp. PR83]MCG8917645.1 DUF4232 domain-containing protein [Actinokineospora sp. PR83]